MKNSLILVLFFFIPFNSTSTRYDPTTVNSVSNIVVYQINSEWNERNTIRNLDDLRGCKYVYGYLEDQPDVFKEKIKSVPAVFITIDGKIVYKYQAGLSMVPTIGYREIQAEVNKAKLK